ncbi:MAG: tyrosine-type recombinase/integrase [Rhodospirillaceae bacterium]|jgi:integrase|nr:tyrosine-type recombinase/integrase [Rhodospirillaceae bacterium]
MADKKRITKRTVDALKPGDLVWDSDVTCFGVRCQKAKKVYVLKYRIAGRQRWYSIGEHGSPWTVEKAREKAVILLGDVANGKDPAEKREEDKLDLTITELCDLYVKEGSATKKASTLSTDKGRIEGHIKPLLGKRRVRALTRGDIERFMVDVANGKTAKTKKTKPKGKSVVRGGKGVASKCVVLLGTIYSFASDRGMRSDNPAHGIKRFKEQKKERFLSPKELSALGEALSEAEKDGMTPSAVNAVRLLAMTGCRKSEILELKWEYVDFERSCFRLPDSKTGSKTISVGAAVLELINKIPKVKKNPYVLPGSVEKHHFVGLAKAWQKIRKKAGIEDVRIHDLRHSFASVGAAGGDSLYMIGKLLGHTQAATTQRYAHLADDPLKATADRIAGHIAGAMSNSDGEVIPLKKQQ